MILEAKEAVIRSYSMKKVVKIVAKFTVKDLCWSIFYQKQPPEVSLKISQNSQETAFQEDYVGDTLKWPVSTAMKCEKVPV